MPKILSNWRISNMYFNVLPTTITDQKMKCSSPISWKGNCIAVVSLPIKADKNIFLKMSTLVA